MDPISTARIIEVHPVLASRIVQLEYLLNFGLEIVQGRRSWNMQATLYAQGRELLSQVNERRADLKLAPLTEEQNVVVTKAQPGYGWHEYGLAVDVAPLAANLKIDWDVNHDNWKAILAKAPSCGLAEGAQFRSFPDNPHLYLMELPATPGDDIRSAFKEAGVAGVWRIVNLEQI